MDEQRVWIKARRKKRLRIVAVILCICLLITTCPDILETLSAFAVESQGENDTRYISCFASLPEEVREQNIPAGTALEELTLPDTLEAVVVVQESEDPSENTEEGTKDPAENTGEGTENPSGNTGEGTENPSENTGEGTENPSENTGEGTEDPSGNTGEGTEDPSENTGEGTEDPSENTGEEPGNPEEGKTEDTVTQPEESSDGESAGSDNGDSQPEKTGATGPESTELQNAETTQETHSVTVPEYNAENVITVETLEDTQKSGNTQEPRTWEENVTIEGVTWESAPAYDDGTAGEYVFTPILPEGYALAAGVSLPEIKVTVESDTVDEAVTAAGELLAELLEKYFDGLSEDEIYEAILAMDEDTRLFMIADYEEVFAAMTEADEADERLQSVMGAIRRGIGDALASMSVIEPLFLTARAAAPRTSGFPLYKESGEGEAFVYSNFREVADLEMGQTYAFLNGIYGEQGAVFALGSGAVLGISAEVNGSTKYIKRWYGDEAEVAVYVDVITPGSDFDRCPQGGLYRVPDSGTPAEYRYFCWKGGAQNCGPYYAYTYEKEALTWENVSASLNDADKLGSADPEDYTVTLTFRNGQKETLDSGSYTVEIPDEDSVVITVSDAEGNTITTNFSNRLCVIYDGNGTNVNNVPAVQLVEKGAAHTLSSQKPARSGGYTFVNWKDANTGTTYAAGAKIPSVTRSMQLLAQWKDTQKPAVSYTPVAFMTRATDAEVEKAVREALTITDNEPVEECIVKITVGKDLTATAGSKNVTVTVTDKAGNVTTKSCMVSVLSFVEISTPVFTQSTKNLKAVLKNPGMDAITESGFVWGIMNSPSLTLNNGKKKTTSPVSKADDAISVTADNLQKGVTYYARAYIVAGGTAYYSEEITIGLGLPAYGAFTIKNNNDNTFTVTRSGGSGGTQTVYYRTVNGSAVGGTHFTHQAATLTFAEGETSKKITVTEQGANIAYNSKPATAYTNADRTYSVELYRVTGGGTLGDTVSAARTMKAADDYKFDRSLYNEYKVIGGRTDEWQRGDWDSDKLGWAENQKGNTEHSQDKVYISQGPGDLTKTDYYHNIDGSSMKYYLTLQAKEDEDGYQHIQITPGEELDTSIYPYQGNYKGTRSKTLYLATLEHGGSGKNTNWAKYSFPQATVNGSDTWGPGEREWWYGSGNDLGNACVALPINTTTLSIGFGGSGNGSEKWKTQNIEHHVQLYDAMEPQLLGVAPMAGGLYKPGDSFTVSLVFDEIVDSTNSGDLGQITCETNWGTAKYAGGADTNVLYFTGTVMNGVNGNLKVTGFTHPDYIMDMCSNTGTTMTKSGSGETTASVDTGQPNFTLTSKGIANGTGTAQVAVLDDKAKTSSLRYVWSDSASMPLDGWVEASASELASAKSTAGLSLSIRKEPGSGTKKDGKWYLHVIGTYSTTGATTYKSVLVDFGTVSKPAAGSEKPTLTVSADNTNWATQRTIAVQAKGGTELKYRKSGETAWTTLTVGNHSLTVTENGYYTFMLTAGDDVITRTVQVEKIDGVDPTGAVGALLENSSDQTAKAGVYTKITLPVTFADAQSGVKTVQYKWTNSETVPTSGWLTYSPVQAGTAKGTAEISYTATEATETKKYLHIRVTDQVGHTCTAKSGAYTVISQSQVDTRTPNITLTGAPTKWTNDMVTLQWALTDYAGKTYEVILPDGKKARSSDHEGQVWVKKNGAYTVTVRDTEYGGENTATVNVAYIDTTGPTVNVSGVSGKWQENAQGVTLSASDSQSGVGKKYYKIVTTDEEIPAEGLTELTSDSANIKIEGNGVWYVYYKFYDKAGDDDIGREANKTEGFAGPVMIDNRDPELTVACETATALKSEGLSFSVEAKYGMSGGNVKVGEREIDELTAEPGSTDGDISKKTDYKVTEKGNYQFTLQTGSGKTDTVTMNVYEADFETGTESETPAQLVVAGGMLGRPDDPERTGYVWKGWYTEETGGREWDFGTDTVSKDMTLYGHWLDETPPDAPVLKDGITLPTGWTNTQDTIPLKLYDGVGVTELWVSVDGGEYQKVSGFTGGVGGMEYDYEDVEAGKHTYRFKAKDAAGNESEPSREFTVMLDKVKPVIGELTYENKAANLWEYIIGQTSLIIHVPVEETGSGVKKISYTMTPKDAAGTPDSGRAETKTAAVRDGEAKIAFSKDFRGSITITCTDEAGNAADSVTVGVTGNGGVIVEDKAPDITTDVREDTYYDSAPGVNVTVTDNKDDVITAGIASITYRVGGDAEKSVTIDTSALQTEAAFSIPASEIPTGGTTIKITARDNAGNETVKLVTVRVKGPEKKPAAAINYRTEKLKDLVPKAGYLINGTAYTADEEGCIPIASGWLGATVSIVKKGNGNETSDSDAQSLTIPDRPQKPAPAGEDVAVPGGTGSLTGLSANVVYEVSTDGGRIWEEKTADGSGRITGLAPGTYVVRVKAGTSNFVSEKSDAAKIGAYQIIVTFMADGETYRTVSVDYGTALTAIPPVPAKKDAGNQIFVGEWCSDEDGTPAEFTNIIRDMTVYAVYSTGYTVTLQSGTGYTLSALSGSMSPVREDGSFGFRLTVHSGYQKTGSFAVKVNGVKVELAEGTYTITDIRENKNVTVDGIEKVPEEPIPAKPSGSSGKKDQETDDMPSGGEAEEDNTPSTDNIPPVDKTLPTDNIPPVPSVPDAAGSPPVAAKEEMGPEEEKETDDTDDTGTQTASQKKNASQQTDGGAAQIVPVTVEDGRIVASGEAVTTGNTTGMKAADTMLKLKNGAVIVTVVCEEHKCTAGVADTVAVANAVLTPEQIQFADDGETIKIRIDVTDISDKVPPQDREIIGSGIEAYQKELPGMTLGMYLDISMFIKNGDGDWDAVTSTEEPIAVVIGIPEKLQEDGREFYIIRAHGGEYTFMEDMDDAPDTITISTDMFSSYAIAYLQTDEAGEDHPCGLCHICPTFLGLCCFIWLAVIIAVLLVIWIVIRMNRRKQEEQEE